MSALTTNIILNSTTGKARDYDEKATVGREDLLGAAKLDAQDAEYQDPVQSLFQPAVSESFRNYHVHWHDVQAVGGSTPTWGQEAKFRFGHEQGSLIWKAELIWTLPAIEDGGSSLCENIEWQPWIGELLAGARFATSYGQNPLYQYSYNQLHAFNRLHSEHNSVTDEAYRTRVGAVPSLAAAQQKLVVHTPVLLPFGKGLHDMFPMLGFDEDLKLEFVIPSFASLVRRATYPYVGATAQWKRAATVPDIVDVRLRVWTIEVEKAEREFHVSRVLEDGGVVSMLFDFSRMEGEGRSDLKYIGVSSFATTKQASVVLTFTKPIVTLMATARYLIDLEDMYFNGSTAVTCTVQQPFPDTPLSSTVKLPCPTKINYLPISDWQLWESSNKFSPLYTYQRWEEYELPVYFKCSMYQNIAVIPFSLLPTEEHHGMGHKTLSSLNRPTLRLTLMARPNGAITATSDGAFPDTDPWFRSYGRNATWDEENTTTDFADLTGTAATILDKQVDIYVVERNLFHREKSDMLLLYK